MTLYSKVARRLFVVFVVIVCGGWNNSYNNTPDLSLINGDGQILEDTNTSHFTGLDLNEVKNQQYNMPDWERYTGQILVLAARADKEKNAIRGEARTRREVMKRTTPLAESFRDRTRNRSTDENEDKPTTGRGVKTCVGHRQVSIESVTGCMDVTNHAKAQEYCGKRGGDFVSVKYECDVLIDGIPNGMTEFTWRAFCCFVSPGTTQ